MHAAQPRSASRRDRYGQQRARAPSARKKSRGEESPTASAGGKQSGGGSDSGMTAKLMTFGDAGSGSGGSSARLKGRTVDAFSKLRRKMGALFARVEDYSGDIAVEDLVENVGDGGDSLLCQCFVMCGPTRPFGQEEFDALVRFIEAGGHLLVSLTKGGEKAMGTNINWLLEKYDIAVNVDSVVRTVYYKYHHPMEVYIANGVVNRALTAAVGEACERPREDDTDVQLVYPYGATLNVNPPAVPVVTSGLVSYPVSRPIVAFATTVGGGRLAVTGSTDMLKSRWVDKEENSELLMAIFQWLTAEAFDLDRMDVDTPDVADYEFVPETRAMGEGIMGCLEEGDDVPVDFTTLLDRTLFGFDMDLVPELSNLYKEVNLKDERLKVIPPQFETPLPQLQPAVEHPHMVEPPPPPLELFDLDDAFASRKARLAQLANKCNSRDVEYFINEAGSALGINAALTAADQKRQQQQRDDDDESVSRTPFQDADGAARAKAILHHVLQKVTAWKSRME